MNEQKIHMLSAYKDTHVHIYIKKMVKEKKQMGSLNYKVSTIQEGQNMRPDFLWPSCEAEISLV